MEAGQFQIRVTVDSVLGEGSPPSLKTATFSLCPHMTEPLTPSQGSTLIKGFPDFSVVKNICLRWRRCRRCEFDLGSGRSPGENPLQYSCLDNPTDGEAWWAAIHGVTKGWAWLSMHTWAWAWSLITSQMPLLQMSSFWSLGLQCVDLDGGEGSHSVHSKHDCRKTDAKWKLVSFGGNGVLCTVSEGLRGVKVEGHLNILNTDTRKHERQIVPACSDSWGECGTHQLITPPPHFQLQPLKGAELWS